MYNAKTDFLVKKLEPDAKLPTRGTEQSAGLDFYCLQDETIGKGKLLKIRTGIAVKVPDGHVGIVKDRSSLASPPYGLHIVAGVIDSDYTGELMVVMYNLGKADVELDRHQKFCQLLILPVAYSPVVEVDEMPVTQRGTGGFGSTSKF